LPNDFQRMLAIGEEPKGGTRFWGEPGGPVTYSALVPADMKRIALSRKDVLGRVLMHGGGHGLGPMIAQTGKAFFTFDVPNTPLRFVILDTTSDAGSSDGLVRKGDWAVYVKPLLDQAKAESKYVVLASHHATGSIGNGSGLGGSAQPDAMTAAEWVNALGEYTNIVFSMVGHSHANVVKFIQPTMSTHPWWEIMTSAVADWPNAFRTVEIWDDDNGWLRLRGISTDFAADDDPIALEGRKLGLLDFTSGWIAGGAGMATDRNVDVMIPKP
jgi:hypothetical protein